MLLPFARTIDLAVRQPVCDTLGVLELYPLPTFKYIESTDHLLNIASFFADFPTKEWTNVCVIVKVSHYVYV